MHLSINLCVYVYTCIPMCTCVHVYIIVVIIIILHLLLEKSDTLRQLCESGAAIHGEMQQRLELADFVRI